MIRIPFSGSAIETPKNSGGDRVLAPIGTPKQLAGESDSPREPISAKKVAGGGHAAGTDL